MSHCSTWYILLNSRLQRTAVCCNTLQPICHRIFEQHNNITMCDYPPAPMNHVKYLRAGPAEMPFRNRYTANTNHFRLTDSVRWKSRRQLG